MVASEAIVDARGATAAGGPGIVVEQRRYNRTPIEAPVVVALKGGREATRGVAKDISVGGMFVEAESPPAFGADVVIRVTLPGVREEMTLPGVVRWTRTGGMGIQFGLLGARETHAITEIVRKGDEAGR
jgi:hypothetical protein